MHNDKKAAFQAANKAWSFDSSETKRERDAFREHCDYFAEQQQEGDRQERKRQMPWLERRHRWISQPADSAQASSSSRDSGVTQPAGYWQKRKHRWVSQPADSAQASGSSRDSGVTQLAASVNEPLVQRLLDELMEGMTKILAQAPNLQSLVPLPALEKHRRQEGGGSHSDLLAKLSRAYTRLLHHTFQNKCSSEIADSVQNLATAIVSKLSLKSKDAANEGRALIVQMLEEKQIEFKWAKIMLILESAADTGEIQAANAYKRMKTCQDKLREERSSRSL